MCANQLLPIIKYSPVDAAKCHNNKEYKHEEDDHVEKLPGGLQQTEVDRARAARDTHLPTWE